jgi:hypothetical protein
MLRKHLIVALTAIFGLFCVTSARAQDFPGLGVGGLWEANMAFENQFYNWAAQGAWDVALATPNDQPLPFNAMTISNSITEGSNAAFGYVRSLQANSNSALDAVGRWDVGAIRDNWYFGSEYGYGTYELPYQPGGYYNVNGYLYGGYNPYYENYYPLYFGW